jgi:hypothetical protein
LSFAVQSCGGIIIAVRCCGVVLFVVWSCRVVVFAVRRCGGVVFEVLFRQSCLTDPLFIPFQCSVLSAANMSGKTSANKQSMYCWKKWRDCRSTLTHLWIQFLHIWNGWER